MKKRILFSCISLAAVFGMVTLASAGSVEWQYFTTFAEVGIGPGDDSLMGTGDDVSDANNTPGAYSLAVIVWDPANPACDSWPTVGYMTGTQVRCAGTPAGGFTTHYMNVTQTPTMPGSGATTITLAPTPASTGDNCGVGEYVSTTYTLLSAPGQPSLPKTSVADGKIFSAGTAITQDYACGSITTYPAAYLESVRGKLPAGATHFSVSCTTVSFGPIPIPCVNNATSDTTTIMWTDDGIDCNAECCDNDADGYDGVQCTGGDDCVDTNPAVHPGATEICGNGLDDDCVGGDEACPGPCAGGAAD